MCCPQTSEEIYFYTRTRYDISQLQSISDVSAIRFDAGVNSFLHGIDGAAQVDNVEIVPNFYQISYLYQNPPVFFTHLLLSCSSIKPQTEKSNGFRSGLLRGHKSSVRKDLILVSGKWIVVLAPWAVAQSCWMIKLGCFCFQGTTTFARTSSW